MPCFKFHEHNKIHLYLSCLTRKTKLRQEKLRYWDFLPVSIYTRSSYYKAPLGAGLLIILLKIVVGISPMFSIKSSDQVDLNICLMRYRGS